MDQTRTRTLVLGAIGVVFGDIGTSPLYALKQVFAGHHPMAADTANVLGVLSLVFWTIMLLVSVKYVLIIMRADNRGEGGSLALLALVTSITRGAPGTLLASALAIFAAALFFGDSMITPAISVLGAVEGLRVVAPPLAAYIVPIAAIILTVLFRLQRRGTGAVGMLFAPIMCVWFVVLGLLGGLEIARHPGVLAAVNPLHAVLFFTRHPYESFLALGAVVLAVTGGEALYTDLGHFGRFPIRASWFGFVLPALLLNYFGQGALLLSEPAHIENPFFHLAPAWAQMPLVVLATAATAIASQAVITGTFSVARQAVQLGYLPRLTIVHTSGRARGQIYIPSVNWTLYVAVMGLVLGFGSSDNLAAAYGIAVTGTMMIDTILVMVLMIYLWRWPRPLVALVGGLFLVVDLAFFSANLLKVPYGGWFPLLVALGSFTLLTTWKRGRQLVFNRLAADSIPLMVFLNSIDETVHRVPGTAVFMTGNAEGTPAAMLHNLKHNQVLHERVFLLTVVTTETPFVADEDRLDYTELGKGFHRLVVRYGFMEHPDIPEALERCACFGHRFDMMSTTFYLSRETIVPTISPGMAPWRERLFLIMSRNATPAHVFFHIPSNRVVELGTLVEI